MADLDTIIDRAVEAVRDGQWGPAEGVNASALTGVLALVVKHCFGRRLAATRDDAHKAVAAPDAAGPSGHPRPVGVGGRGPQADPPREGGDAQTLRCGLVP